MWELNVAPLCLSKARIEFVVMEVAWRVVTHAPQASPGQRSGPRSGRTACRGGPSGVSKTYLLARTCHTALDILPCSSSPYASCETTVENFDVRGVSSPPTFQSSPTGPSPARRWCARDLRAASSCWPARVASSTRQPWADFATSSPQLCL